MRHLSFAVCAALLLGGCMGDPARFDTDAFSRIADSRITFPPPDPAESGPLIFEFYRDGTALLVLNEVADRGQTPLVWRVAGNQLCVTPTDRPREECMLFVLRGDTIIVGTGGDMNGTSEPL